MTLMSLITKIIEKNAEFKLNIAYKQSRAAMNVFVRAKQLLVKANNNLEKTQKEVLSQLDRLSLVSEAIADESNRNMKYMSKIDSILE